MLRDSKEIKLMTHGADKTICFANKFNFKRDDKFWLKQVIKRIS